jgi:hypothetical protein
MAKAKQNKKKPTNVAPEFAVVEDQAKTEAPGKQTPQHLSLKDEPVTTPATEKSGRSNNSAAEEQPLRNSNRKSNNPRKKSNP